jgi:hypothetical protein
VGSNNALFILTASECIKVYRMTHMDHAYPSSKHLDATIKIGITFCVQGYFAMRKSLFVGVRRHTTSVRPGEDEGECSAVFGGVRTRPRLQTLMRGVAGWMSGLASGQIVCAWKKNGQDGLRGPRWTERGGRICTRIWWTGVEGV